MAGKERWLNIWDAANLVMTRLKVSVGAAQARLCEACASGMVRWRRADWRYSMHIGIDHSLLTRDVWRRAHIDLDEGEVADGHRRFAVAISNEDLHFWLLQELKGNWASEEDDSEPYQPLAEVTERIRQSNPKVTVEDILSSIIGRCVSGQTQARARRRIYGSEKVLWISNAAERRWYAKAHSRLSGRFEKIPRAEWEGLSFDLDEHRAPTGELVSNAKMRLAWASVEFKEINSPDISAGAAYEAAAQDVGALSPEHLSDKGARKRGDYIPDLKAFMIELDVEQLRLLKPQDIARLYLDGRAVRAREEKPVPIVPHDLRSIARQVEAIREDMLDQAMRAVAAKGK
jgi:hypothetical protein